MVTERRFRSAATWSRRATPRFGGGAVLDDAPVVRKKRAGGSLDRRARRPEVYARRVNGAAHPKNPVTTAVPRIKNFARREVVTGQ
jgi:hypothetical protein